MKKITSLLLAALLLASLVPQALAADTAAANTTDFSGFTSQELLDQWNQLGYMLRLNGAYPYSELEKNDTGYEVTALQTQLAALDYYQKEIVDNFGNGTYNALRAFEKEAGLKVNGIANAADQQALYVAAAALTADDTQPETGLDTSYSPEELLQLWTQVGTQLRTNGSYPYVQLRKGDIGYEVTMLQTRLSELGYYQKKIVDNFGSGTFDALRYFEKQNGLVIDGIASPEDQQVLFSSSATNFVVQTTTKTNTNNNQKDGTSEATQ